MSTIASPPSQPSRVSPKTVEKAIKALLKWRDSKSKNQKPQLLEHDEFIYLIITLKKIPQKGRTNPHKISLPHPLINPTEDSSEFCLIIDDRSKSQLTKDAANKKIKADNVPISKVLKLSKLKSDYKPFEAKRKLCDSYDMFFADKRVIPLLPRLLGKQFFKKKKIPVPVDLKHKNWKEQIENACGSALLYMRTGTCSVVKVGKLSMGTQEIADNVMAAVNAIAEIVPSKWKNIRSFHLKLLESLALPIYQAVPNLRLKIEASTEDKGVKVVNNPGEEVKETFDDDDNENKKEKMLNNKKKKGRIHDVRYMDSSISEMLDANEVGGDEEDVAEGEDTENDDMDTAEIGAKKRKKGHGGRSEKPSKKLAKMKKEGAEKKSRSMEMALKDKKKRKK